MKIYEVWDHDPMASSMGEDYIAERYVDKARAEAAVERRNAESRLRFEERATNGKERSEKEPWNWRKSRMTEAELIT